MARQAEAEREKRAKIIHAEGELDASEKLSQAAAVMTSEPLAITLRYLQTLTEIAAETELDDHLSAAAGFAADGDGQGERRAMIASHGC